MNSHPHQSSNEPVDRFPLSFAQQSLWLLAQMEGVSEAYNMPMGLRLKGKLDRAALHRTLDRIIVRHEPLRTTFSFVEGEPVQMISAPERSPFTLIEHDLRHHEAAASELDIITRLEASERFNLETGPPIRGRLIQMSDNEHILLITMHHIVSDGWSLGVLVNELSALYSAFVRKVADPLPELEFQYVDYAAWQRKWIDGDILQRQSAYWKNALLGAPAVLELPTDRIRPAQQNHVGSMEYIVLDADLTAELKALSRKHKTTLFMTLLAGWAVLLSRLSGEQDVVIGTPVANRDRVEFERLIGFFVNTLPVRLNLSGSPSVGELLGQARSQMLAAQQNKDIPFEQIVEILKPERSLAHTPLFQVMFAFQNAPEGILDLPELELEMLELPHSGLAKFDLTLSLRETAGTIAGGLEYSSALFDPPTIERYLRFFNNLLQSMVADDAQPVDRLRLLAEEDRRQFLYGFNETGAQFRNDVCIHQLFEEQVARTPGAVALVFEDLELTYAELNWRANQLANYLRRLGVKPEARVAICLERGFDMIVALLAVLKAGGAYVPVDPAYPVERIRFMLQDSEPVALLTTGSLQGLFTEFEKSFAIVDLASKEPAWIQMPQGNIRPSVVGLTPDHLAYVIYTSGSTGMPKGVMVEHRSLANSTFARTQTYGSMGRFLLLSPISFDSSVAGVFGVLTNAGTLVVASAELLRDPSSLYAYIQRQQVDTLLCVPSLFQQVLEFSFADPHKMSLSRVVVAGEECPRTLVSDTLETQPHIQLFNEYGPTECTVWASVYRCSKMPVARAIPIGRPIANTQIYILDAYAQPVPLGVAGELYIGGKGVARGYLNRPELTAEKFLPDPFASLPGQRMYRTGDLGRWLHDGNIEFLGRNDFQVKIRGFRIELGEIEASLAKLPEVRQAAVIAREDTAGDKRLVAYYTSNKPGDDAILVQHLRAHLSAALPEHMVPAAFVCMKSLPLTPNGKLDRKALPMPELAAFSNRAFEPPVGEMETQLAAIWADVLKLDRVGRHDNFFEIGGHSLLAVQVTTRSRSLLNREIPVRELFAHPQLADLAHALESAASAVHQPIKRAIRKKVQAPATPLAGSGNGSGSNGISPDDNTGQKYDLASEKVIE